MNFHPYASGRNPALWKDPLVQFSHFFPHECGGRLCFFKEVIITIHFYTSVRVIFFLFFSFRYSARSVGSSEQTRRVAL